MKNLTIIANVSQNLGLGYQNQLLWRLKPDLRNFREVTTGHVVVMGGKTFESIGKALPGRENVVLSREEVNAEGVKVFHNTTDLDEYLEGIDGEKFIIGGASIYKMYIERADKLILTEVEAVVPADAFFPEFKKDEFARRVLSEGEADGRKFTIVEYRRKG